MVNDIAIVRIVVRVRVNVIFWVIVSGLQKCVANILLLLIITKYLLNKKPLRFPLFLPSFVFTFQHASKISPDDTPKFSRKFVRIVGSYFSIVVG